MSDKPIPYDRFNSGITYQDAWRMLYVHSDDRTKWVQKGRGAVLSLMGKLKADLYQEYLRRFAPEDLDFPGPEPAANDNAADPPTPRRQWNLPPSEYFDEGRGTFEGTCIH